MVVAVKNAGRAVTGDENVGPAILVEVESGDAERVVPVGSIDMCLGGDVFKRAVAFVVIKNILRARQTARAAHYWNSLPNAGRALARCGSRREIEVHVVGDD